VTTESDGLFAGLRVVEIGHYVAGPFAGQLLADQGADVIKVEPPGGDAYRADPGRFVAWNRGKRSVVLDLKTAENRERLRLLMLDADVVIENYRPGVLARLGIDFGELQALNPGLVTCSISGFGSAGPLRDMPGWEPIVHARAGVHVGFGEHDERVWRPFPLASVAAGLLATFGIVAALLERDRSGQGQHVETSLFDAALYMNGSAIIQGDVPPMHIQGRTDTPRVHIYPTADGWLQVVAGTEQSRQSFEDMLKREDSGLTPDVAAARAVMATRASADWEGRLAELGVPAGACGPVGEWLAHPLAVQSGLAVHWADSPFGELTTVGPPVRGLSDSARLRPPPALGSSSAGWREVARFGPDTAAAAGDTAAAGILDGVTILDLTRILPGPLAGRLLAEIGAHVVKIEPPGGEEGYVVPFMYLEGNRSKASAEIDLKLQAGRDEFRELVRAADVVIENARAGVWDRLGLGDADLHALKPDLIYARSKGYGVEGPYAKLRAFEHVIQAMTGMQQTQGGSGPPRMMTVPACDYAAPLYLSIGILCSLLRGRRMDSIGSRGATVDASLAVAASVYEAEHLAVIGGSSGVHDDVGPHLRGPDGARQIYPVADGWVVIFAATRAQQDALCRCLQIASPEIEAVAAAVHGWVAAELVETLGAAGIAAARSVLPQEVSGDAQVISRGLLCALEHPTWGRVVQVGIPFSLSRNRPAVRSVAPVL
jgi:crotonobetainyl-CoA:carnitine CoA-transferase CaiB-like acyl-CoA transferase